jgi:SPP1 family predicted phage head-tail adaptor
MRAGRFKFRIEFTSPTTSADEFGQEIETYSSLATVWAEVINSPVTEDQSREGTVAKERIQITMRARDSVTTRAKVEHAGKTYSVVGVWRMEPPHYMRVIAERAV